MSSSLCVVCGDYGADDSHVCKKCEGGRDVTPIGGKYNSEGYKDPTAFEAMKKYKNHLNGARSKVAGKDYEDLISAACLHYWAKRIAHIEKTPEPFHVTRSIGYGKFEGFYDGEGQPDFKGVIKGGRAVCFEAKHTDSDRIKQDTVKPHQADSLDSHEEMGAWCFVMVSILRQGVYRVPWQDWKNMKEKFGHKYMSVEELKPYVVPFYNGIYLFLDK